MAPRPDPSSSFYGTPGTDDNGDVPVEQEEAAFERFLDRAIAAELATGRREKTPSKAKRNVFLRLGAMILGPILVLLGLAMVVLPGPGLLVVAAGLYLMALEIPFAARLLEKVKERLPHDEDGNIPKSAIVTMVVMTATATIASIAWVVIK